MSGKQIALNIGNQLGGLGRLKAMTGANNFVAHEDGLSFKFKSCKRSNYCKVTLDPSDTYTVEFGKIRKFEYKVTEKLEGVYCDMLMDIFEGHTGLYLTLSPRS